MNQEQKTKFLRQAAIAIAAGYTAAGSTHSVMGVSDAKRIAHEARLLLNAVEAEEKGLE